jgi:hypothetical protein
MSHETAEDGTNPDNEHAPSVKKHGIASKTVVIGWAVFLALVFILFWISQTTMGTKSSGKFTVAPVSTSR